MSSNRLRLRLFPRAESAVRKGHPWVFEGSIKEQNREGAVGEIAVIYDRRDQFLALGLFDPASPIRVRIVHAGKPATIGRAWWQQQLRACLARREAWIGPETTGCRLVNGESEGFPGLVVDRYGDTLVCKIYSAIWLPHWGEMEGVIREVLGGRHLVLRMSRNIQQAARETWGMGEGFRGILGQPVVTFHENGIAFEAAVIDGQKTGFFLDQRDNRARVEALASGRDVLNVFSFSGGFSLYAARGGARSVTDVDISNHALESARRNFALNDATPGVADAIYRQVQADAFQWLEGADDSYDLVIVDPPSLAKRQSERDGAISAYEKLNRLAIQRLRPGGILVAASCSAHVDAEAFHDMLQRVARQGRRRVIEHWRSGHAPDHPATFAEACYLKACCLEFF